MRSGRLGRTLCRAIAGPVALVLIAGTAAATPESTKAQISAAESRLSTLETQISSEQARVLELQSSMKVMAAKIAAGRVQYQAVRDQIARTQLRRAEVEAQYQAIRREIDAAAANAYMRGPGYGLETLMSLDSLSDASYVIGYTTAIARRDADLAARARILSAELAKRQRQEFDLLLQRGAVLSRLSEDQGALTGAFVDQQGRLADLANARSEVGSLLTSLREQLRAEEIAAAEAALAHGTPLSFGKWASAFLSALHAPVTRNNLVVVVAWETAEYTTARWNPLATTWDLPGSTPFNSSQVRNYISLEQGLEATIKTLRAAGHGYESILSNLGQTADPMTTGQAINASDWCSGCAGGGYVVDMIPTVEQYYDRYASASA